MHEKRTIAISDPGVCQSVSRLCYANTTEQIEVLLLGMRTLKALGTLY